MTSIERRRRVLLCVDGSDTSERATRWYLDEVSLPSDTVILAHIADKKLPKHAYFKSMGPTHGQPEELDEKLQERIKAVQEKFEGILKDHGFEVKFVTEPCIQTPGHHLCRIAKREMCTLIIIGSRGHNSVRRTIFGSTSDYVLHHAHVPCILYPDTQHARARAMSTNLS